MSGFYTDYLNTIKNPSYVARQRAVRLDTIDEHWTLFAEGRNLTDKTYAGAVVVNDSAEPLRESRHSGISAIWLAWSISSNGLQLVRAGVARRGTPLGRLSVDAHDRAGGGCLFRGAHSQRRLRIP
jgi:hypothetical protein